MHSSIINSKCFKLRYFNIQIVSHFVTKDLKGFRVELNFDLLVFGLVYDLLTCCKKRNALLYIKSTVRFKFSCSKLLSKLVFDNLPHQIDGDTDESNEYTTNANHSQHPMIEMIRWLYKYQCNNQY